MRTLEIIESWPNTGRVDRTFIARFDDKIRVGLEFAYGGKTYRITYKLHQDDMGGRVCFAEVRFFAIEV